MKTLILFILWLFVTIVGMITQPPNHHFGIFLICAIAFPILTFMLFSSGIGLLMKSLGKLLSAKKKYREIGILEKNDVYNDSSVEQITLDHPDYIGILTKINKKKIARNYLRKQKGNHGRK